MFEKKKREITTQKMNMSSNGSYSVKPYLAPHLNGHSRLIVRVGRKHLAFCVVFCSLQWMFPKNRGKTSKMDGENKGKPLLEWMIWGFPPIFGLTPKYPLKIRRSTPNGKCVVEKFIIGVPGGSSSNLHTNAKSSGNYTKIKYLQTAVTKSVQQLRSTFQKENSSASISVGRFPD